MVLFQLTLETGKAEPQRRTIRKLAETLEADPDELVREEEIAPSVRDSSDRGTRKNDHTAELPTSDPL